MPPAQDLDVTQSADEDDTSDPYIDVQINEDEDIDYALKTWDVLVNPSYKSVSACAEYFQVPRTTLRDMIRDEREEWTGLGGSKSKVFTPEEEKILKNFIVERVELGVGLTLHHKFFCSLIM